MRSFPCTSSPAIAASALPAPAASVARYSPTGHPSVRCMSSRKAAASSTSCAVSSSCRASSSSMARSSVVTSTTWPRARSWGIGIGGSVREASPRASPRAARAPARRWCRGSWVLDRLDVVEGHRERRPHRRRGDRQAAPPGGEVDAAGRGQRPEDRRLHGLQAVECGGEVAEERPGVVVPRVQADPGLARLAGLHPLTEQGRLPVPGGSDHGDDRGVRGEQPPDEGGAGHEPGPAPRRAQLRLEQLRFQPERRRAPPRGPRSGPAVVLVGMGREGRSPGPPSTHPPRLTAAVSRAPEGVARRIASPRSDADRPASSQPEDAGPTPGS